MATTRLRFCEVLLFMIFLCSLSIHGSEGKSVKLRKSGHNPTSMKSQHVQPQKIYTPYPQVKVLTHKNLVPSQSSTFGVEQSTIAREKENEGFSEPVPTVTEIQSVFDTGLKAVFKRLRVYLSKYFTTNAKQSDVDRQEESPTTFPGLPTTPIFQRINVGSVLKVLEATDGLEAEALAETAVIDILSQLGRLIGFEDLRDWLGIILMHFLLGPILIPLFWLPISLFGMAGLLVPLFLFNPPSKLNTGVVGHDPIVVEQDIAGEKRSFEKFPSTFPHSREFRPGASSNDNVDSCLERVSCHITRLYRDNPISKWLTSHFNTTQIEYARAHPSNDINGDSSRAEFDCSKYSCRIFPAA